MISTDTHAYLQERFGDYMVMPSKATLKQAQHAYIWDVEKDYSVYVGKNDKSQEKDLV